MSYYSDYLEEIEVRKKDLGLNPKPIDSDALVAEIVTQIKDAGHKHRADSLHYLIYNLFDYQNVEDIIRDINIEIYGENLVTIPDPNKSYIIKIVSDFSIWISQDIIYFNPDASW